MPKICTNAPKRLPQKRQKAAATRTTCRSFWSATHIERNICSSIDWSMHLRALPVLASFYSLSSHPKHSPLPSPFSFPSPIHSPFPSLSAPLLPSPLLCFSSLQPREPRASPPLPSPLHPPPSPLYPPPSPPVFPSQLPPVSRVPSPPLPTPPSICVSAACLCVCACV